METEPIIISLQGENAERANKGEIIKTIAYPEGIDNVDKAIIDIINASGKSMSINTLKNKYLKTALNFDERVEKLTKVCSGLKTWEQKKPTLQIGTEYHKSQEVSNDGD